MRMIVSLKQDLIDDELHEHLSHLEIRADATTPLLFKKRPFILTLDAPCCPEKLFTLANYAPHYLDIPSSMPKSFFDAVRRKHPGYSIDSLFP